MKLKKTIIMISAATYLITTSILFPLGGVSKAKATATYGSAIAADLLSGKTVTADAGQITGTMPNMTTANPNGMGVGRSNALQYWTGGGTGIYFKPQSGYYDGVDTWTEYTEPNLVPGNILSGKSILGVTGTLVDGAGMIKVAYGSGIPNQSTGILTVTGLTFRPYRVVVNYSGGYQLDSGISTVSSNNFQSTIGASPMAFSPNASGFTAKIMNPFYAAQTANWTAYGG